MAIYGSRSRPSFAGTCLAAVLLFIQAPPTLSQDVAAVPVVHKRPTLGLVLEGGGALGLAHIGVIQWLEEHRIPVNYVAGTSMGGLVGGIYATGRSPVEVRDLVNTINWDEVLRGVTPFDKLSYRRKEDAYQYPTQLEFGLRKGMQLPGGFNSGQDVSFILDRVALPYSEIDNFNQLPIPFGCVATDLAMDKAHVFRDGSLSLALRSTMSLPGIFTPVRDGDHLFADGGLVDNLPVDVAKDMGADVTLAVHLQTKPLDVNEPMSIFGVLGQSVSVVVAMNELRSMEKADLLIAVPLDKYSSLDYGAADAIIKAGYDAAQSKATMLSSLSVDEATWQRYLAERAARRREPPVPKFVEVAGTDKRSAAGIEKDFADQLNKPVNTADLQNQLLTIRGDGRYSSLDYQMVTKNDEQGLQINAQEKPYAPPIVRPLVLIDGSQYNNVLFSLGGRITFLDIGGYGSEWRNDVIFGTEYGITSEYYRPFRPGGKWFVAPRLAATSSEFNGYTSDNSLAALYRERQVGGGADVGYEFGRAGELRLGYQAEYFSYSLEVGEKGIEPTVAGRQSFSRIKYQLLNVDDPVVPRTGQLANFRTQYFDANPGGSSKFFLTEGQFTNFTRIGELNSIFLSGGGGTTYGDNTVGLPVFALGGSLLFPAWGTDEILTNQYSIGTAGYLRQLAKLPPLIGDKLYFEGKADVGQFKTVTNGMRVPADASAALVVNTIFGPAVVGVAVGDSGHHRFYFGVGRVF